MQMKKEVRNSIRDSVGVHDDLIALVKLRSYGHVSRVTGMSKTILQTIEKEIENTHNSIKCNRRLRPQKEAKMNLGMPLKLQ